MGTHQPCRSKFLETTPFFWVEPSSALNPELSLRKKYRPLATKENEPSHSYSYLRTTGRPPSDETRRPSVPIAPHKRKKASMMPVCDIGKVMGLSVRRVAQFALRQ